MAFSFPNLNFKFKLTLHYNKQFLFLKIAFLFSFFIHDVTFLNKGKTHAHHAVAVCLQSSNKAFIF